MYLLSFGGLPGTGKSTLAEAVGRALHTPVFALDWLLGACMLAALRFPSRESVAELGNELLTSLAQGQLRLGQSAILDSVTGPQMQRRWQALAESYGVRYCGVETICSDLAAHRARVEARQRNIPGWHEVPWDHVERLRATYRPWGGANLTLDAMRPLSENLGAILSYLRQEASV
jgi:predicted kinase